jgi:hypothetical protein
MSGRYVIIHEVCHLVHRNHSSRFWGLVAKFDPTTRNTVAGFIAIIYYSIIMTGNFDLDSRNALMFLKTEMSTFFNSNAGTGKSPC